MSDTFASYGRYWLELFRLPSDARGSVEDRVTSVGFEHITAGLEAGKGVILALPHVGGFDFAAAWLAGRGLPPAVVVEAVEPPRALRVVRRRPAGDRHGGDPARAGGGRAV